MQQTEAQIETYLSPFKEEIQVLARQLRHYLKKSTAPAVEIVADSVNSLNIGYGFTEKAWDCYCAIIVYRNHINISFPSGAGLSDVHGLLHGSGKRVRHLKLKSMKDVDTKEVLGLLLQARDLARKAAPEEIPENQVVRTLIKQVSGIKKRPG